jgi:hypothetical protein
MNGDVARTESGIRAGHDLRGIILFTLVAAFLVGALIVVGFLGRRTSAGPSRLEAGRAGALSAGHGGDS